MALLDKQHCANVDRQVCFFGLFWLFQNGITMDYLQFQREIIMFPMKIAVNPAKIGGRSHWLMTLIVRVGRSWVMTLAFPIPSQVLPLITLDRVP